MNGLPKVVPGEINAWLALVDVAHLKGEFADVDGEKAWELQV